jgi:hypothetical protein
MNERIKQLAEQAGYSWHNQFSGPILSPNAIEKFAELIVKECYLWSKENGGLGCEEDFEALKEHFGVEE